MRRSERILTLWSSDRQSTGNNAQGELLDQSGIDASVDRRDSAAAVVARLHCELRFENLLV